MKGKFAFAVCPDNVMLNLSRMVLEKSWVSANFRRVSKSQTTVSDS